MSSRTFLKSVTASTRVQWAFRTLSLLLGIAILGLGNAAMALQRNDRGAEVSNLQTRLTELNCYNSEVTGYFGPKTEAAVKLCQQQFGLTADGIAGPQTMAALNGRIVPDVQSEAVPPSYSRQVILKRGSEGNEVRDIQQRLTNIGFSTGGIDGSYGAMTEEAVRQFQRSSQLPVDGKFGTQEMAALDSMQPSTQAAKPSDSVISLGELKRGDNNSDVTRLQQRLKEAGHFNGNTTKFYGDVTEQAVRDFQASRGLWVTGIADAQTLESLGLRIDYNSARPSSSSYNSYSNSSAFNRSPFTSGISGNASRYAERPRTPDRRYVVVVPNESPETLNHVKVLGRIRDAKVFSDRKGEYVEAGAFSNRAQAEKIAQNLRARGLDARVDYQ